MNQLAAVKDKINLLPKEKQAEILGLLDELEQAQSREGARTDFLTFVNKMWPAFIAGRHHSIMADAFERVAKGFFP